MPQNFSGPVAHGAVISFEFWTHQICSLLLNNSDVKALLRDFELDTELADRIAISNLIILHLPEEIGAICKDGPDRYRLVE